MSYHEILNVVSFFIILSIVLVAGLTMLWKMWKEGSKR